MSAFADRLRGVLGPPSRVEGRPVPLNDPGDEPFADNDDRTSEPSRKPAYGDASDVLGGEWHDVRGHRFLVVDRKYAAGYRHGRVSIADCLPDGTGSWPRLELLAGFERARLLEAFAGAPRSRLLFLDLETTGLAGGAGTYAFLVGCGWFDGAAFRIRQFFLSDFGAERALLESVAELAASTACVVTYNGKTFDLPLIETRYVMQRMQTPFADLPHVDMLHPARRMWREDDVECRLTHLERILCGYAREGDVPGFEIPSRYFHFVRSGDARPLDAVLEHNRLDIISLAMLTARAAQLLDDGPSAATTAREALGMGRLYERAGLVGDALASFTRATRAALEGRATANGVRADALRAQAVLLRRLRRYADAASAWRELLGVRGCPDAHAREATEALAVHHEHRIRDLDAARTFALQALQLQASAARQQAVKYRLARIDRKRGETPPSGGLPLGGHI